MPTKHTPEPLRALSESELDAVSGAFSFSDFNSVLNKISRTIGAVADGLAATIQASRPCK